MDADYLKSCEAARLLGLSESYLAKLRMGRGPIAGPRFVRVGPRAVRYRLRDLHLWMEQRTISSDLQGECR